MKIIKELPRDFLRMAPRSISYRKKGRKRNPNTPLYKIVELLKQNPLGVYEVDCESKDPTHPRTCPVAVDLSRINAMRAAPRRVHGYHTMYGTFIFWMEADGDSDE